MIDRFWQVIRPARILTGRRSFFVIPEFSYGSLTWKGASEVVAQYNYTVARNFVLPRVVNAPANASYCACIRWHDGANNVHRYKLWENIGEVLNVNLISPNKVIGKDFTIEIWNTQTDTTAANTDEIEVRTSLKTAIDDVNTVTDIEEDAGIEYPRTELVNTNVLSSVYSSLTDIATAFSIGLKGWYKLDSAADYTLNGGNVAQWNDSSGLARHVANATPAEQPIFVANGLGTKNRASVKFQGIDNLVANFAAAGLYPTLYIILRVNNHVTGSYSRIYGTSTLSRLELSTNEGQLKYQTGAYSSEDYYVGPEQLFLVRMTYSVAGGGPNWTHKGSNGPILVDTNSSTYDIPVGSVPAAPAQLILGLSTNNVATSFEIGEVAIFDSAIASAYADADQAIRRFLANKFENLIEIPLIFGSGAVGTPVTT